MSEENIKKKEPLSVLRLIVAGIGVLIMVVSGGCTLLVGMPTLFSGGGYGIQLLPVIIIFGAIPFSIGLTMFYLATHPPGGGKKRDL